MAVPDAPVLKGVNVGGAAKLHVTPDAVALSYKVYRDVTPPATTEIATGELGPVIQDFTVSDNTAYTYRVKATNLSGDSDYSNAIRVLVQSPLDVTTTPTGALHAVRTGL